MERTEYIKRRREVLLRNGIDPKAIAYLIDLELADPESAPGIAGSLSELPGIPVWTGRRVTIAKTGRSLVFNGRNWELQSGI